MRHQPVYHDIKTTPGTNKHKHGFHRFQFYNIVSWPSDEWSRQHSKEEKLKQESFNFLCGVNYIQMYGKSLDVWTYFNVAIFFL